MSDTARGFLAALTAPPAVHGETINLGSNFEISVEDTARMIADILKVPIQWEQEAQRVRPAESEVERLWADNQKARRLLNWQPEYGGREGLRRGLEETIAWFRKHGGSPRYATSAYHL